MRPVAGSERTGRVWYGDPSANLREAGMLRGARTEVISSRGTQVVL